MTDLDTIRTITTSLSRRNISLAKATHWELAKGHLRAIVAAAGTSEAHEAYSEDDSRMPFEVIGEEVENFIQFFEGEEFHL